MDKYEIIIFWSDEDQAYVADVPELPGCMAHGDSHESALQNARSAIELWIETAKEFGDLIPPLKAGVLPLPKFIDILPTQRQSFRYNTPGSFEP